MKQSDYRQILYVDPEIHRMAKVKSAMKEMSIKDYITELVRKDKVEIAGQ